MWQRIRAHLGLVRFSHTVFALPFALIGALLAAGGLPSFRASVWTIVAVIGARTCAMAFNRLVDRRFDALNPRTATRALAAGALTVAEVRVTVAGAGLLFVLACRELNGLALALSPCMLALILGYSLTKRFTWASHLVLGSALALAPFGGWIAVRGDASGYPLSLSLGVVFWVAGFDTIYACLDEAFDRRTGLHSLPARFGRRVALGLARLFHVAALACFTVTGSALGLGAPYATGLLLVGVALLAQHLTAARRDLSWTERYFLPMNGAVSVALLAATWLALTWRG